MNNITIIGIAGGSASGKTTVVRKLKERFTGQIQVLGHDNYYRAHDDMPFSQRCQLNYDHPDAFETELLVHHIEELRAGRSIDHPTYDYTEHNRAKETIHMEPMPVIIVEGILVLENEELSGGCDRGMQCRRSDPSAALSAGRWQPWYLPGQCG